MSKEEKLLKAFTSAKTDLIRTGLLTLRRGVVSGPGMDAYLAMCKALRGRPCSQKPLPGAGKAVRIIKLHMQSG